jgi:NAD(P)-dependent dehydrogenase (short-subunit alcohol dehydrogenase family)
MEWSFKNKVIVVTGAGGVLCSEFSRHYAKLGAKVALINRSVEKIELLEKELTQEGYIAKAYQCDVLDQERLKEVHQEINKDFGLIDILVNGAGGNMDAANTGNEYHEKKIDPSVRDFFKLDSTAISNVFTLNFMGTLLPTQEFASDMCDKEGCSILNVSSMSSYNPLTKVLGYSAAKAAVNNLTQWLSVHFSHMGIRVNAVAPGFFVTKQNKNLLFDSEGNYSARSQKILAGTPMGKFGVPEDLLGTITYLVDYNASAFVTGVIIPVDGGFSAYSGV